MAEDSIDLNLRARYDRKAGVFRLTAADPKLEGLPFQVTLSRGSESVESLQSLFFQASLIGSRDFTPSQTSPLEAQGSLQAKKAPRAVFVGPEVVGDAILKMKPDWNFQNHEPSLESFQAHLADGTLTNDLSMVLIIDQFFDSRIESKLFVETIAWLAPYALIAVVSYHPEFREEITSSVAQQCLKKNFPSAPFYFIDPKKPGASLDSAIEAFLGREKLASNAREGLRNARIGDPVVSDELPESAARLNPISGAVEVSYSELMKRLGVSALDTAGNRRALSIDLNG